MLKPLRPHKGFLLGAKRLQSHRCSQFLAWVTPPPNPFIGVYASIALFFFWWLNFTPRGQQQKDRVPMVQRIPLPRGKKSSKVTIGQDFWLGLIPPPYEDTYTSVFFGG